MPASFKTVGFTNMMKSPDTNQPQKVVLISLGQLVDTNIHRSVAEFTKIGISKAALIWHWVRPSIFDRIYGAPNIGTLVDQYKSGKINTDTFRNTIIGLFPRLKINREKFDRAWNAMCLEHSNSKAVLTELKTIEGTGVRVLIASNTNPLHVDHLKSLLPDLSQEQLYLSYEKGKLGMSLMRDCMQHAKATYPDAVVSIMHLPAPALPETLNGFWGWFKAPVKKLFHAHALQGHNAFVNSAQINHIQPHAWDINSYVRGSLCKLLSIENIFSDGHAERLEQTSVLERKAKPPVTPLANTQREQAKVKKKPGSATISNTEKTNHNEKPVEKDQAFFLK